MRPDLYAPPNAGALIHSLRSVGYSFETAIADIVDNSISAGASIIHINVVWTNELQYISICDNGEGMSEQDLHNAMVLGSKDPTDIRPNKDLGRFGLGMKTAAFSLCKRLSVVSKTQSGLALRGWDIDFVSRENKWILFDDAKTNSCLDALSQLSAFKQGTVVILEVLDRLITEAPGDGAYDRFWKQVARVENHLSMTFHRFLSPHFGIRIYLNNHPIIPWDPFLKNNYATQEFSDLINYKETSIPVTAYILPHHSKLSKEEYNDAGGSNGWLEQQGFYVYRVNRLIVSGTWFRMLRKDEPSQLARIQLDLDSSMDFDWLLDVKKSSATPPALARSQIRQLAKYAQEASRKVYYYRGAIINKSVKAEDNDAIWEQASVRGKTYYRINKNHRLLAKAYLELSEDTKKGLLTFISMVEGFAPMNIMTTGATTQSDSQKEQLISAGVKLYNDLIDVGYLKQEALYKIKNMFAFSDLLDAIEAKINNCGV